MAPVTGAEADAALLHAAATLAKAFDAELAAVHAPADVAELAPWMGDGMMGAGLQPVAIEELREMIAEGETTARRIWQAQTYAAKTFVALKSLVASGLALEARLSDLVVFDDMTARGQGPLTPAFQQIVAVEQRPTVVARPGLSVDGYVAVAWDGGKEAARAVRTALPLLQKAAQVTILTAPSAKTRELDPERLRQFLEARGVSAGVQAVEAGDVVAQLLETARGLGASMLVAGAYGHARLREFIFGGATRALLNAEPGGPSLFLSH